MRRRWLLGGAFAWRTRKGGAQAGGSKQAQAHWRAAPASLGANIAGGWMEDVHTGGPGVNLALRRTGCFAVFWSRSRSSPPPLPALKAVAEPKARAMTAAAPDGARDLPPDALSHPRATSHSTVEVKPWLESQRHQPRGWPKKSGRPKPTLRPVTRKHYHSLNFAGWVFCERKECITQCATASRTVDRLSRLSDVSGIL